MRAKIDYACPAIEVGQEVLCKDTPDIVGTVLFIGKKHALLEGDDGEEWAIYIDSLEPVKSDAEKLHDAINKTPVQNLADIEARAVEKFKQHIITLIGEDLSGDEECDLIVPIHEFDFFKSQLRQQAGSGE